MKTRYLLLLFLLPGFGLFAQEPKGVVPVSAPSTVGRRPSTVTRAVVVGISDYQSPAIPDLRFANRDAEAFVDWLKSPAGGSVPKENIQLLVNNNATNGKIYTALYWLMEQSQEGDNAIFYFSGHGDVEAKTRSQSGFLLAHDSPPTNYIGSAVDLHHVQEFVSTLSIDKKVRVLLITDACHAGKLAGTGIGGTQATAQALARQYANEVKIMSCQPNEFSLEGKQWGDGRGLFSWHLVDGLTGLADKDHDQTVSLFEIRRYLEDRVSNEAAPHQQMPMTVGELQTPVSQVDASALAALVAQKSGQQPGLLATKSKGFADALLSPEDSILYAGFQSALDSGFLLSPRGRCAADIYAQLAEKQAFKPLHGLMRRNLAAALIDEVQQALNALLDNDPYESNNWFVHPEKYNHYPEYLQRALELIGESNYLYRSLLAKKRYFEGYNLAKNIGQLENQPLRRDSFARMAKTKFLESIRLEPDAAYPYFAIGNLYFMTDFAHGHEEDSLVQWESRATTLAPGWLAPYLEIAYYYSIFNNNAQKSEDWLTKALALHPDSYLVLERLSWLKQWQCKADESIAISKQMIAMKPDLHNAYSTLATTLTQMKGEYFESEKYCLASVALEPNQWGWAQYNLAINYLRTGRAEKAVDLGKTCLESPNTNAFDDKGCHLATLTAALVQLGRYEEAEHYFRRFDSLQFGNGFYKTWIKTNEGRMQLQRGQLNLSEKTLQAALRIDSTPTNNPLDIMTIWTLLGEIQAAKGQTKTAEAFFQKALGGYKVCYYSIGEYNFWASEALFRYGKFLLTQNRPAEAEVQFREIGNILPKSYFYGYGMALLYAQRGRIKVALDWLERALDNYWPDGESIGKEPFFEKIRKTKRFKALLAKNFPPGWENR